MVSRPVVTGSNQSAEILASRASPRRLLFPATELSAPSIRAHHFSFFSPSHPPSWNLLKTLAAGVKIETKNALLDPIPRGQRSKPRGMHPYLGMQVTPFVSPQIKPDALSDQITREFMLSRGGYRITLARVITSIHLRRGGREGEGKRMDGDMPRRRCWRELKRARARAWACVYARVATRSRDTNFYCDPSVRNDVHGTRAATWTDNRPSRRDLSPPLCASRPDRGEINAGFPPLWKNGAIPFLAAPRLSSCSRRSCPFRSFIRSNFWTRLGSVTRTAMVVGNARDTFTYQGTLVRPGLYDGDRSSRPVHFSSSGYADLDTVHVSRAIRPHRFETEQRQERSKRKRR